VAARQQQRHQGWLQAELTAGINHTSMREGYLPIMDALARWECDVLMSACEQATQQQPNKAACDPEALISHVHTCASVVDRQVPFLCSSVIAF
jgi:hypothetical protein